MLAHQDQQLLVLRYRAQLKVFMCNLMQEQCSDMQRLRYLEESLLLSLVLILMVTQLKICSFMITKETVNGQHQ